VKGALYNRQERGKKDLEGGWKEQREERGGEKRGFRGARKKGLAFIKSRRMQVR